MADEHIIGEGSNVNEGGSMMSDMDQALHQLHNFVGSASDSDSESSDSSVDGGDSDDEVFIAPEMKFIPECEEMHKPKLHDTFATVEEAIKFYTEYGRRCGFGVRLGSTTSRQGALASRYVYCYKQGLHVRGEGPRKRKRVTGRTGCNAMITLKLVPGQRFEITKFVEEHNHEFYEGGAFQFMRAHRNLTPTLKKWITDNLAVWNGPVRSHKLLSQLVGGSQNVGATVIDFLNFERDLKVFIGETDGHFIVQTFHERAAKSTGFYFEHDTDNDDRLLRLFWADGTARKNYELYGDNISFDSTYKTNRYGMVFCPFTGVDNNRKCVTLGIGVIRQEDAESFSWVFRALLKCMKNKHPISIITDQDLGMKKAIADTLSTSNHRLCMWHIMEKVKKHVPKAVVADSLLYKNLVDLVWDDRGVLTVDQFETKWAKILKDFDVEDNQWLRLVYNIRRSWIPAYSIDVPMSRLLRTTSHSESVNSVYGMRRSKKSTLVQFMWWCDTILDDQRQTEARLVSESSHCTPKWTREHPAPLEQHAWELYNRTMFYIVQADIDDGLRVCGIKKVNSVDGIKTYNMLDPSGKEYVGTLNEETNHCTCECKRLESFGLICMHMFGMMQTSGVVRIPQSLINRRWCRRDISTSTRKGKSVGLADRQLWGKFHSILGNPKINTDNRQKLMDLLNRFTEEEQFEEDNSSTQSGKTVLEELTGLQMPDQLLVKIPPISTTKGTCRYKTAAERSKVRAQKPQRICRTCGKTGHDSRTCSLRVKH